MKRILTVMLLTASLLYATITSAAGPTIEMVRVPGGCFQMGDIFGDSYGDKDRKPVHQVCLDDFSIGKFEVTQAQWQSVMGSNPSTYKTGGNYPVETVSWDDVQQFITILRQQTGINYRLPTEAEWEYAARSGGKKEEWAGINDPKLLHRSVNLCDVNCEKSWKEKHLNDGYATTAPVGSFLPNGLGLYDMSGNVDEWCQDWYEENYYEHSVTKNPKGPESGKWRVIRGGSWFYLATSNRTVNRSQYYQVSKNGDIGFRLAVSAQSPVTAPTETKEVGSNPSNKK